MPHVLCKHDGTGERLGSEMSAAPRQKAEERLLLEWCRSQGVVLDGVRLDGRRLVATRDLAVGHCAISVPKAAVLSTDQAMASDVGQRILAQPDLLVVQDVERQRRLWLAGARHLDLAQAAVTRRSVLYAFLIHLRGSGGPWGAYADALPKSYGSPFTWEARELGTDLRDEVSKWREHLDGQCAGWSTLTLTLTLTLALTLTLTRTRTRTRTRTLTLTLTRS